MARLGRIILHQAGVYSSWAGTSIPGWAGILAPRLGRDVCAPGWDSAPQANPAGPEGRCPGWAPAPQANSGWASWPCPGWAFSPRPGWAPGRASAGPEPLPRLGLRPDARLGFLQLHAPAGPDREDPAWPGFLSRPAYADPGWAGLTTPAGPPFIHYSGRARPGFPGPGRITPLPGRYSPPPAYFTHPASTPAPCASPGTPLGSDWHILHHYMLVLGRPLAQTSISLLS
jgi:hypothetical protein